MIEVNGEPWKVEPGDGRRLFEAAVVMAGQKREVMYQSLLGKLTRALERTQAEECNNDAEVYGTNGVNGGEE